MWKCKAKHSGSANLWFGSWCRVYSGSNTLEKYTPPKWKEEELYSLCLNFQAFASLPYPSPGRLLLKLPWLVPMKKDVKMRCLNNWTQYNNISWEVIGYMHHHTIRDIISRSCTIYQQRDAPYGTRIMEELTRGIFYSTCGISLEPKSQM